MTHPGTPSVFLDHLEPEKLRSVIVKLGALRKQQGIHCRSQASSSCLLSYCSFASSSMCPFVQARLAWLTFCEVQDERNNKLKRLLFCFLSNYAFKILAAFVADLGNARSRHTDAVQESFYISA